jgi:serine/threonine protein kinase
VYSPRSKNIMGQDGSTLHPMCELSEGAFSKLLLCRVGGAETEDREEGGRPVLLKATRIAHGDREAAERLVREIDLTARALSSFVVLSHGWQISAVADGRFLLMLLEYCSGGDVGLLIDRSGPITPVASRFYIGCAALALEALHRHGIVHRDVKPDNLVIASDGYVKLCDLGYAREMPRAGGRAQSLLGTPEYLAPEAFLGEGQDFKSDMWSLGVSFYTMLLAAHPWGGSSTDELYERVLHDGLFFPNNQFLFSAPAKGFASRCLSRAPADRPAARDVWQLPFFAAALPPTFANGPLEREALERRAVEPPFSPRLSGPFDTRFFELADEDDEDEEDVRFGGGGRRRLDVPQQHQLHHQPHLGGGSGGSGGSGGGLRYALVEQPGGEQTAARPISLQPDDDAGSSAGSAALWPLAHTMTLKLDDFRTSSPATEEQGGGRGQGALPPHGGAAVDASSTGATLSSLPSVDELLGD